MTFFIISTGTVADFNDFEYPAVVTPKPFKDAKLKKNTVTVQVPAKSIVVLNIK